MRIIPWLIILGLFCTGAAGCYSKSDSGAEREDASAVQEGSDTAEEKAAEPEQLTLQPFDPPSLEELDKSAEWIDGPVVDTIEALRSRQAESPSTLSIAEATKLRNDSKEANEKIVAAMGRLPTSDSDVNWDDTFNRHMLGDVKSINPILVSSIQEFDIQQLIGFNLFTFDQELKAYGDKDTIVSWQTSKDRLIDKVVMRKDLTWSDGKPITAHDVVFSFQTIMNPKVPVPAVRSGTDKLRWVHAYDDHTVVFFHREALATNIWNVLFPTIPKHIYEGKAEKDPTLQTDPELVELEYKPVVSGPYQIVKRTRNEEIVCQRRESWYMHEGKQVRAKPYFKEIRFHIREDPNTALLALKSAAIDELELKADQWQSQTSGNDFYEHNTKATGLEWAYFYFGWNNKSIYFRDRRVREAISFAFDHDELIDNLFHGLYQPSNGVFHPTSWMAPKNAAPPYKQNLDKAEELLDAAGWTDSDGDGTRDKEINGRLVPFEFTIVVRQDPPRVQACELLKHNLDQIGIVCNIMPLEGTVLQERMMKHEFEAAFGGWSTGTDPDTSDNIWATGEQRNFLQYSNAEVDELYKKGRKEFDQEKRAGQIYARIHELIYKDQPCTFLYYQNSFYAFNNRLRGWNFSPRGPFHYSPGVMSIWAADN